MRPNDRLIDLVAHALGEREAPSNLTSNEKERVAQLQATHAALRIGVYSAPIQAVQAAKALFVSARTPILARLTGSTLRLSEARSASAAFQASYECELGRVRLAYSSVPEGWSVMGRVDGGSWTVECGAQAQSADDGAFEFRVDSLESTELIFVREQDVWIVPAATEGIDDDDRRGD